MNLIINSEKTALLHKSAEQSLKSLHVFLLFAEHMDEKNQYSETSFNIAEKLDCSNTTAEKAIRVLAKNGIITIGKSGGRNIYTVSPEIVRKE